MDSNNHFSLDYLAEFVDGRLPAQAQAAVSAHLNTGCPECTENVNFLRRFRQAGQTGSWPIPPHSVHRRAVQAFRPATGRFPQRSWPRLGQALAAALAIVIILAGVIWFATPPAAYAASISEISGQVEFRPGGQADWRPASVGQKFLPGSEIRTSSDSQTALNFPNGERLQLSENTLVILNTLTYINKQWQISLRQDSGQTDSQVDPQAGLYLLQTPAGDIAANGTRFGVRVEADGETFIDVHEGSVTATTHAGKVRVKAGQSAQITLNALPMVEASTTASQTPTQTAVATRTKQNNGKSQSTPDAPNAGKKPTHTPKPEQTETPNGKNHSGAPLGQNNPKP